MVQFPSILFARTGGLGLLVLAPLPGMSYAEEVASVAPGVSGTALIQMLLGLTLIVGFLFLGAYFLRKLNGGRGFGHSGPLRVVGGLMLSVRERIVLVELGDTWIVVGIVPGQIKTLLTLPKGEIPASNPGEKPFGQWLKQMTERKK